MTIHHTSHTHNHNNKSHRKLIRHSRLYAKSMKTVWGKLVKTTVLNDAGSNAYFGTPWSPDEGEIDICDKYYKNNNNNNKIN